MKEKFCAYCYSYRKDDGRFKTLFTPRGAGRSPTPRSICGVCQDNKKAARRRPTEEKGS